MMEYATSDCLTASEKLLLRKYNDFIERKQVLDIGIGGGRTTAYLLPISGNYYGIDYSSAMVDFTKERFPKANISCRDARDLSCFENGVFDFVLFSFNGIDCVEHEDRIRIMSEVKRIMKDSGVFMFSSHNRAFADRPIQALIHGAHRLMPITVKSFSKLASPAQVSRKSLTLLRCMLNRIRMKRHEVHHEEYAILNDMAHEYSGLNYYIDSTHQDLQLSRLGFELTDVVSTAGIPLSKGVAAEDSVWLYYVARNVG